MRLRKTFIYNWVERGVGISEIVTSMFMALGKKKKNINFI